MYRVSQHYYTKQLPADAKIFVKDVGGREELWAEFQCGRGQKKTQKAPLTKDGTKIRLMTETYYVFIPIGNGKERAVKGYTDKKATEQLAARLEREAARCREGLIDPKEKDWMRPLVEYLQGYQRHLLNRGDTPRYVQEVNARLQAALDGCGFRVANDIKPSKLDDWLAELRRPQEVKPLDPLKEEYTLAEACVALEMKPNTFSMAVLRNHLPAGGWGRSRRYPRETIAALQGRSPGKAGRSMQTTNQYLSHFASFCDWLGKSERLGRNPLGDAKLGPGNEEIDRRHDRRAFTVDELMHLLEAARTSNKTFMGLTGLDRHMLYATAISTGLRASALASLTPESFNLDSDTPTLQLAARKNKSRKARLPQPIPGWLASALREYLLGKHLGQPIWDGKWAKERRGAAMMRLDLHAAGIPYATDGPDGKLFADFHAQRHTFITMLGRAGENLQVVQAMAGHASPIQTMGYSHMRLYDLAGAAEKIPDLLNNKTAEQKNATEAATGTEGGCVQLAGQLAGQRDARSRILSHGGKDGADGKDSENT